MTVEETVELDELKKSSKIEKRDGREKGGTERERWRRKKKKEKKVKEDHKKEEGGEKERKREREYVCVDGV